MTSRILIGDCLALMPTLGDGVFDSVVTDPPYGIKFMGKAWDNGVPGVLFWRAALHTMKPGAYLLAFGGTRKFHRLACAIEDAGFELHDTLSWLYGSGFPKHRSKLKPGWEPIILARRSAAKATPLNIDACRIGFVSDADEREAKEKNRHADFGTGQRENRVYGADNRARADDGNYDAPGRWPANVAIDEEAAALIDEQSGVRAAGNHPAKRRGIGFTEQSGGSNSGTVGARRPTEIGGASRFYYCAKASRAERNAGLEGREKKPLLWSSGTQSPGTFQSPGTDKSAENNHATVKPVALMRWLCRLVTPAGGHILDPFVGSGSTGIAARLEGFAFTGIDDDPHSALIATERIAHHEKEVA